MFQTAQERVSQAMDGAFSFLPQDSGGQNKDVRYEIAIADK